MPRLIERARVAGASVGAAVLGAAPHVLHHAGPFAGAALLAGTTGTLLFGAVGFVAAIPLLRRIHRHSGSWRAPIAALGVFVAMFTLSATVIGPALTDADGGNGEPEKSPAVPDSRPGGHEGHHR